MLPDDRPQTPPFIPPIPHSNPQPAHEITFTLSPGNDITIGSHTVELRGIDDGKALLKITYHKEYVHG